MKWIVFAVGLLTAVFGVWWSWDGYSIVLVERGWAKHIAGSVFFGAGLLTVGVAALMHKVQQLAAVLADARPAPRAYAPPPYAPEADADERHDSPAHVAPADAPADAPTAASAAAIPTGAAAAALATSLPALTTPSRDDTRDEAARKPAKQEDDDMLAAVGAALAAQPPAPSSPEPSSREASLQEPALQERSSPELPPLPPMRPVAPFTPKLPEAREPFVFRPPPPLPRAGETTLDFSMPPSERRPSFGRDPVAPPEPQAAEPQAAEPKAVKQQASEPQISEPQASEANANAVDDVQNDAPADAPADAFAAPPPSEAPKLDHLFDDLPPPQPKPADEPQRRRSSFDWLSTARRRAEPPPAPEPAPQPEPEPVEEAVAEAAPDATQQQPTPDIAEELVDAPVAADEGDARLVRRYESQGVKYSLYEDGSIRAESDRGVFKFGSLAELRGFLEKGG